MQRFVVVGSCGAGKTTLAREIARRKNIPHIEMDALHWKANWTSTPTEELRPLVRNAVSAPSWTSDGNYLALRGEIWGRADTLIWLDYSFAVVFGRVLQRTLRRVIKREELWSGNRETWQMLFSRDSILWFMVSTYHRRRRAMSDTLQQPEFSHLRVLHFQSPRQTAHWLQELQIPKMGET